MSAKESASSFVKLISKSSILSSLSKHIGQVNLISEDNVDTVLSMLEMRGVVKKVSQRIVFDINTQGHDAHLTWKQFKKLIHQSLQSNISINDLCLSQAMNHIGNQLISKHLKVSPEFPPFGKSVSSNLSASSNGIYKYCGKDRSYYDTLCIWSCDGVCNVIDKRLQESVYFIQCVSKSIEFEALCFDLAQLNVEMIKNVVNNNYDDKALMMITKKVEAQVLEIIDNVNKNMQQLSIETNGILPQSKECIDQVEAVEIKVKFYLILQLQLAWHFVFFSFFFLFVFGFN